MSKWHNKRRQPNPDHPSVVLTNSKTDMKPAKSLKTCYVQHQFRGAAFKEEITAFLQPRRSLGKFQPVIYVSWGWIAYDKATSAPLSEGWNYILTIYPTQGILWKREKLLVLAIAHFPSLPFPSKTASKTALASPLLPFPSLGQHFCTKNIMNDDG